MSVLQWDRLLETCCRREARDLLLTAGAAPMIRQADGWHSLATAPLDTETLERLVVERFTPLPQRDNADHAVTEFVHRVDDGATARFRATAIGYPSTTLLLVARVGDDKPTSR